jgi:hypothetical protein
LAIVLNGTVCTTGSWPANVTISTAPLIASILLLRDFFQHAPELARGILKTGASELPVFGRSITFVFCRLTQRFTSARAHAKVKASTYPNGGESRPAAGDVNTNQSGRGRSIRCLTARRPNN